MLGDQCHRGNHQKRIIERDLSSVPNRVFRRAVIDVINAEHVGDEQSIKLSFFQDQGQLAPVFQIFIGRGTVSRMPP